MIVSLTKWALFALLVGAAAQMGGIPVVETMTALLDSLLSQTTDLLLEWIKNNLLSW